MLMILHLPIRFRKLISIFSENCRINVLCRQIETQRRKHRTEFLDVSKHGEPQLVV